MTISDLFRLVSDGSLVSGIAVNDSDIVASLDARDRLSFSERWIDAFNHVEATKVTAPLDVASQDIVSKARELAYLQAFKRWRSADLAAYISDDVGLIADAIITNCMDSWLDGMLQQYVNGHFPGADVA